ncbi:MAG TPA: cobalamin biosynthesis protein [Pseudonocardia sp.]|nr:cobalamin biosynthesis protein [Pseudonocardia sp.]
MGRLELSRSSRRARAAGLLLGVAADAVLGDPARWHPVAGFGRLAAACERRAYADTRSAGVLHLALCAGVVTGAGWFGGIAARRGGPVVEALAVGVATWAVVGGASLAGEASALADSLIADDLDAARARIPHLCGRDPESLDPAGMVRAGCESVAENTSDAVVGPLLWGALAGLPGLLGYRAVNTLDAMVGHRSERYRNFGWASARTDDLLNLAPSRLTAALIVALAPLLGGRPADALTAWRRDAGAHPSPNAGPVEAAAAGALGIRLGGLTVYPHAVEERPALGDGHPPTVSDLRRMVALSRAVTWGAAVVTAAMAVAGRRAQNRDLP